MDNKQSNDARIRELALFAGAGGGILGGKLLGWRTVCAVERDAYAAAVLAQRQTDRHLEAFPIWSDVCTFDGKPWRGIVDVISGGFPCQDISIAGKGAGLDGERSGLWFEFARIIGEVRPRFVFVENSPALTFRGLGRVLGDLSEMGYNAECGIVSAGNAGAPHVRKRIWILANSRHWRGGNKRQIEARGIDATEWPTDTDKVSRPSKQSEIMADANCKWQSQPQGVITEKWGRSSNGSQQMAESYGSHGQGNKRAKRSDKKRTEPIKSSWWETEPELGRVADGVANRVDRLKAIGNGQVPRVAQIAWEILTNEK